MKAINIYLLTRSPDEKAALYESSLSGRHEVRREHREETRTLKLLVDRFLGAGAKVSDLDGFFSSFTIPHISKEFDLLKFTNGGTVLNIELKSQLVEEEQIEKQLAKNRYYLNHIATEILSFTFVTTEEGCKVYAYDGKLRETTFDELAAANINMGTDLVLDDIESFFEPTEYLISPLTTPDRFLNGEYYLTDLQGSFKTRILESFIGKHGYTGGLWGITGSAGTGKTLLLYDIAKVLSTRGRTLIVHAGMLTKGHKALQGKVERLDLLGSPDMTAEILRGYDFILVDEAQRLKKNDFKKILAQHEKGIPCVFSYDYFQTLSAKEQERNIPSELSGREHFTELKLTNKIRTNKEVVLFIRNMRNLKNTPPDYVDFTKVEIAYAGDKQEAEKIIEYYSTMKQFHYINYTPSMNHVIGQEFDNVLVVMDEKFRYDKNGVLLGKRSRNPDYIFYKLWFQGVSRARERLCIVVVRNANLFDKLIKIKCQRGNLMNGEKDNGNTDD